MKRLIVAAIRCSLMFLVPSVTYAISAQWDLDPVSGDWNTADNWTPMGVPNGPADIATLGLSHPLLNRGSFQSELPNEFSKRPPSMAPFQGSDQRNQRSGILQGIHWQSSKPSAQVTS